MNLRPLDQRTQGGPAIARPAGAAPRRRGVLGGLVVLAVGTAFLLQSLQLPAASASLFVALGAAFGAAYALGYRQFVYLVPAAVLMGIGVGLLFQVLFDLGRFASPIFFGALAAAFVGVTALAPDHRWPLIPAIPLAVIAAAGVVGRVDLVPPAVQPFILPVVLIGVALYLLFEPTSR